MYNNGVNTVTALRVLNGEVERKLPPPGKTITLGASRRCGLSFPDSGMSGVHVMLEVRDDFVRVHDQGSRFGTFFHSERIKSTADIRPADIFSPTPMSFLAMNDVMREYRVVMHEILGAEVQPSLDRFLIEAVRGANHYLLYGDSGSDQERLAHAIHYVSHRRREQIERLDIDIDGIPNEVSAQKEIVTRANLSTLVLVLSKDSAPLPQTFSGLVFAPSYQVRVIAIAPSIDVGQRVLPRDVYDNMTRTWIRPLATRVGDIPELIDRLLAERNASFRFSDLTFENRSALCKHEWSRNFDALRALADQIVAFLAIPKWDSMTLRERVSASGIARSTLGDWYTRHGLTHPLRG